MRLIDADALIDDLMERYCKECNKRRGIKNGKYRIIYEIGEAPCRACEVDDVKAELEEAPTADAVEVVRCRDCQYYEIMQLKRDGTDDRRYKPSLCVLHNRNFDEDYYCADGERRTDDTD